MVRYMYQQDSRYFARISRSIQEMGVEELAGLGARDIKPEFSGIRFRADAATLYRINYLTRLVSGCLAPLTRFQCPDPDTLYQKAKQVRWEDFFQKQQTFAISATVSDSEISHSKYAALRLKDAIADYFTEKNRATPGCIGQKSGHSIQPAYP